MSHYFNRWFEKIISRLIDYVGLIIVSGILTTYPNDGIISLLYLLHCPSIHNVMNINITLNHLNPGYSAHRKGASLILTLLLTQYLHHECTVPHVRLHVREPRRGCASDARTRLLARARLWRIWRRGSESALMDDVTHSKKMAATKASKEQKYDRQLRYTYICLVHFCKKPKLPFGTIGRFTSEHRWWGGRADVSSPVRVKAASAS